MTSLTFLYTPPTPCAYNAATSTLSACLPCATAHETRLCDGTSSPYWELCPKHQEPADQHNDQHDEDMLKFIRESVYDGSIPKPLPKPLPRRPQPLRISAPGTKPQPPAKKQSNHVLWPTPIAHYEHVSNCFHHPGISFVSERHLAHVKDAITCGGPLNCSVDTAIGSSTALQPSVKILSSPSAFLALERQVLSQIAQLSLQIDHDRTFVEEYNATRIRSTASNEDADTSVGVKSYAHNDEESIDDATSHACSSSSASAPASSTPSENPLEIDPYFTQRLDELTSEARASRLAKCVFFRRCDGSYVNALGRAWQHEWTFECDVESELSNNSIYDKERCTSCDVANTSSNHNPIVVPAYRQAEQASCQEDAMGCMTTILRVCGRERIVGLNGLGREDLALTWWVWNRPRRRHQKG